jgi:FtsH-binding integral membrane protein
MSYGEANPYRPPLSVSAGVAASALEQDRVEFIRRTYLHLGGAVLGFVALEAAIFALVPAAVLVRFSQAITGNWLWLAFLAAFMAVSWIARSWAESTTSRQTQYAGLALYVAAQAILFVPLLLVARSFTGDPYLIPSAALITLMSFGGLTAVVLVTRADFSFLRMFLFWAGIIALGAIVCSIVFGLSLGIWFSVAMVALAGGYILYDTSNVLHHYRTDQYVAASLALFASVALLFWYVLQLLMSFSSRD